MNAHERETVITTSDGDGLVRIWTAQRKVITRLHRDPRFTEVKAGTYEGAPWAEFTIPADQWSPVSGAKRSRAPLTEDQRQALVERLTAHRKGVPSENPHNDWAFSSEDGMNAAVQ